jgi:hypothetical protein
MPSPPLDSIRLHVVHEFRPLDSIRCNALLDPPHNGSQHITRRIEACGADACLSYHPRTRTGITVKHAADPEIAEKIVNLHGLECHTSR